MNSEMLSVKDEWKIIQIIPAREGFAAVFSTDENSDSIFQQVVCLALVENKHGERLVTGLDDDLLFCEDSTIFCNYINLDNLEQINKRNESQLTPVL